MREICGRRLNIGNSTHTHTHTHCAGTKHVEIIRKYVGIIALLYITIRLYLQIYTQNRNLQLSAGKDDNTTETFHYIEFVLKPE